MDSSEIRYGRSGSDGYMNNASLAEIAERSEFGYGLKWVMVDWGNKWNCAW